MNEIKNLKYDFYRIPKKASLLLSGNERSVLGILIDDQQMSNETECTVSISYICKNLNITDKTTQSILKNLIQLEFITKQSGYNTRKPNIYSVNFNKIQEYDEMSYEALFKLRDTLKKNKSTKSEEPIDLDKLPEYLNTSEVVQPEYSTEVLIAIESEVNKNILDESQSFQDANEEAEDVEEEHEDEVFLRFENYFGTFNNGLFQGYSECIDSMSDNFTDDEIQYVTTNRKTFFENCKLGYNTKNSLGRDLLFYMPKEKKSIVNSFLI